MFASTPISSLEGATAESVLYDERGLDHVAGAGLQGADLAVAGLELRAGDATDPAFNEPLAKSIRADAAETYRGLDPEALAGLLGVDLDFAQELAAL